MPAALRRVLKLSGDEPEYGGPKIDRIVQKSLEARIVGVSLGMTTSEITQRSIPGPNCALPRISMRT